MQTNFTNDERETLRMAVYYLHKPERIDEDVLGYTNVINALERFCEDRGVDQTDMELELEADRLRREREKLRF